MIIPISVDVPMRRMPWANWGLIGLTILLSIAIWMGVFPDDVIVNLFMLHRGSLAGYVGSLFIHGGFLHLLGNMVFLWAFGNAVCAKIGNGPYLGLYLLLGVLAGLAHVLSTPVPAIGASGAINGVVGAFLVLYPANNIRIFYWIYFWVGTATVASLGMILLWLLFDVFGVLLGWIGVQSGVAYMAHIGGFAGGAAIMTALVWTGLIRMERGERSLLGFLGLSDSPNADGDRAFGRGPPRRPRRTPAREAADGSLHRSHRSDPDRERTVPLDDRLERFVLFPCPGCGRRVRAPRERAGQRARCPSCGATITVP